MGKDMVGCCVLSVASSRCCDQDEPMPGGRTGEERITTTLTVSCGTWNVERGTGRDAGT